MNPSAGLAKEPITIGIIRDMTGAHSEAGRSQIDALKFIFDGINEKGGIQGHKIEYKLGDEKCNPDRAASLARRFINVNNVLLLAGTSCSGAGLAMMKIAIEEEVPVFGHAYSVKMHEGEIGKWYFAQGSNNEYNAKGYLALAQRDGIKEAGVIWVNYAWGRDAKDNVYKYAKDYGIKVVGDVPVELGAAEATAEVSKMKALNPPCVMIFCITKDQAAVIRGFAALNWKPVVYGTGATLGPAMRIVGKELVEGWRATYLCNPNDPHILAVIDKFKAKYGETPPDTTYFMETYDSANVLVNVFETMIKKGEPLTRSNLRDAMEKYSAGVDLLSPTPRKSPGWGKPPHILIYDKDWVPLVFKNGQLMKY
jgi:ABC-type branched-subunit amino acid transport system substrate-binding protein